MAVVSGAFFVAVVYWLHGWSGVRVMFIGIPLGLAVGSWERRRQKRRARSS
jgi:hypothetical protein